MRTFILASLLFLVSCCNCTFASENHTLQNLSLYRPVSVSTTSHYPCIAEFAVDGETDTGWRSARELPTGQTNDTITIDLQADCNVELISINWASQSGLPVFEGIQTADLNGSEQVSSYAIAYSVAISSDARSWQTVYHTTAGSGGNEKVHIEPVSARFVRIITDKRSNPKCGVGINEIAVMGTCSVKRPEGDSWKLRRKAKQTPASLSADSDSTELLLDSGWELFPERFSDLTAAVISDSKADTSNWYNAVVPGTILTSLVEQGVFPEPTIGMNNLSIPDSLCRMVWWYRTELSLPDSWRASDQTIWLDFDGINHDAEIWLNSKYIGQINGAFIRGKFDITNFLNSNGKNTIAVRIIPPAHPGIPLEKSETDKLKNGGVLGKDSPTFVASIGWDWLPGIRDRGMGIWDTVRLSRSGSVVLGDPQVITDLPLPSISSAQVTITVPVTNHSDKKQNTIVSALFDNLSVAKTIELAPGAASAVVFAPAEYKQLNLNNPRLWWPAGCGEQYLYDLSLSASINGKISDGRQLKFGVRELSYRGGAVDSSKVEVYNFNPVKTKYIRLNCLKRATKYGFSIFSLSVFNSQKNNIDLAVNKDIFATSQESDEHPARHANDNNPDTRWGSEYSEPHWICVDLGSAQTVDTVQVSWEAAFAKEFIIQSSNDGVNWTDIKNCVADNVPTELEISVNGRRVLCKGGNWGYPEVLLRNTDSRLETTIKLHSEANLNMIRNWVGQSTTEKFYEMCDKYGILIWNDFWLANPSDGPNPVNDQLFLTNVKDAVSRYRNHPSIAVWCGRNEGLPPKAIDDGIRQLTQQLDGTRFYQDHSAANGVNGHGPYRYVGTDGYFTNHIRGFKTEIGMPSVPSADSMRKMLDSPNPWPLDLRWAYHDFAPIGAQQRGTYISAIENRYGKPDSLDDFCKKAQLVNYDGYRAIFEACNHKLWNDCSGLLLWMSHPAWPSTVWQIYDYWYGTDGAFFGTKKANEPTHIQFCPTNKMVELINHTNNPVNGIVTATALTPDAQVLWQKSLKVEAQLNSKTDTFPVKLTGRTPKAYFLRLAWTDTANKQLSENYYLIADNDNDMQAINSMPQVTLKASVLSSSKSGQLKVKIHNDSKALAYMTTLTLVNKNTSKRILPAFYSDNYLSLLPGESKEISIEYDSTDNPEAVSLLLDGWNITPSKIN